MRPTATQQKQDAYFILEAESNPSAATIVRLLEKHDYATKQCRLIERVHSGDELITEQVGIQCEEAFMQLRQLYDVLQRNFNELAGRSSDAARLILAEVFDEMTNAEGRIKSIRRWRGRA